jgi:hypothetical protein
MLRAHRLRFQTDTVQHRSRFDTSDPTDCKRLAGGFAGTACDAGTAGTNLTSFATCAVRVGTSKRLARSTLAIVTYT